MVITFCTSKEIQYLFKLLTCYRYKSYSPSNTPAPSHQTKKYRDQLKYPNNKVQKKAAKSSITAITLKLRRVSCDSTATKCTHDTT